MVKLNEIHQTATFAWSSQTLPILATGSAAGVIDDDFSSTSTLSFFKFNSKEPKVTLEVDAKFQDLDWSKSNALLAGALENGSIQFWNTEKLASEDIVTSAAKGTKHTGTIKTLQFNPLQHNILASGGSNSEIYIWDTNKLDNLTPFAPGAAMTPLDTVTSVAWNNSVTHIFASAGSAGYTSIWDLKAKKEVLHLNYTSPTGTRANLSVVQWHPSQSTKLVTASETDGAPVILTWDLRNSKAPETVLEGHKKGVLSLDWNTKDSSLLLSSGKDNTTILWNPLNGQKLAQYPTTANWIFKTRFAPESPDVFANASFDKKVVVQTLQDTSPPVTNKINATSENEFWNQISDTDTQQPEYFVKQAPNWYGRHSSVAFGFGGKLVKVIKEAEKSSKIEISKVKLPGSKDNEDFTKALASGDFTTIIENHISESYDNDGKADWELLNGLSDKTQVFNKFISLKVDDTPNPVVSKEGGTNDEDFFNKLESTDPVFTYLPSGSFKLSETPSDLSQALLSKDLTKAVDFALKQDKLTEALIIALNGPEDLKQKVRDVYFNKFAQKDPLARLLYSVSSGDVSDIVENSDVSDWRQIGTAIKTYSSNESISNAEFVKLGDRLLAENPIENRNDAIKAYLSASALDKIASIWVKELKSLESKILKTKKSSAYDAHFESLTEFVEKFSAYRSVLKLDAPVADSDDLLSIILEYTTILSSSGQFELASKFLSLLSDKIPAVKLEKERIAGASLKTQKRGVNGQDSKAGSVSRGRFPGSSNSYSVPQQAPVVPSAVPQSSTNPYLPAQPTATANASPFVPQYHQSGYNAGFNAGTQGSFNNAQVPVNPYKPAGFSAINSVAGVPNGSGNPNIPPPPKNAKKLETEGWNDLPSTFHKQSNRTPAAPSKVATPVLTSAAPVPANGAPPQASRNASFSSIGAAIPPPPRAVSRAKKVEAKPSQPPSPQPNNRYTPPVQTNNVSSPQLGNLNNNGFIATPPPPKNASISAPKNPYAPPAQLPTSAYVAQPATTTPPIARPNQYAPPSQTFGAGPTNFAPNPYGAPQQTAPPTNSVQNPYGPPPSGVLGSAPNYGAPIAPANAAPLTAAAQIQQQQQQFQQQFQQQQQQQGPPPILPSKQSEPPKSKYPAGDRSHIPESSLPIYEVLSQQLEFVKPQVPENYAKQVVDTEKRLNILFDHLNNEDLLTEPTLDLLKQLTIALNSKDFGTALGIHLQILTNHSHEGGNWLVGVKRLIQFAEAVN